MIGVYIDAKFRKELGQFHRLRANEEPIFPLRVYPPLHILSHRSTAKHTAEMLGRSLLAKRPQGAVS